MRRGQPWTPERGSRGAGGSSRDKKCPRVESRWRAELGPGPGQAEDSRAPPGAAGSPPSPSLGRLPDPNRKPRQNKRGLKGEGVFLNAHILLFLLPRLCLSLFHESHTAVRRPGPAADAAERSRRSNFTVRVAGGVAAGGSPKGRCPCRGATACAVSPEPRLCSSSIPACSREHPPRAPEQKQNKSPLPPHDPSIHDR